MNCTVVDVEYVLEQYELLRGKAIQGHGLHLFLSKGMVAWINAVSCLSGRQAAPTEPSSSPPQFSSRPEVTTALANMVLECMQEVHA
jgi:hypothetical protein